MIRLITLLTLLGAVLPAASHAQTVLSPGDRIRFREAEGAVVIGVVSAISAEEVRLATQDRSGHVVSRDQIESLERSLGTERRFARNLFISVGAGAAIGGVMGAVTWKPCRETGFLACFLHPASRGEAAQWGTAAGALIGVPIGVIVGLATRHEVWEPLSVHGPGGSTVSIRPVVSPDLLGVTGSISVGGF
ncbi:MAG: hypothetical protein OEO79_00065 [Gemmatimonadota bacterium]|nr:hypothetical protein [Gemmatimonadota bacterium]MDH3424757.1 hypothetical protein [Gemmatimonadota bacterium]